MESQKERLKALEELYEQRESKIIKLEEENYMLRTELKKTVELINDKDTEISLLQEKLLKIIMDKE